MTAKEKIKQKGKDSSNSVGKNNQFLILHNDEFHTFDYVIKALVEVCEHDYIQATQCTVIVHHKGKCDVRRGNFRKLKPLKDALIDRELRATID